MRFDKSTRLMVVAAHPDDEVLGCGGTLAKALDMGAAVEVVFLGEGVSSRFPIGDYSSKAFEEQTARRSEGARKALRLLGIDAHFGTRLCCQFDQLPLLSIVKEIEQRMATFRPTMLFTHNPAEVNIDHRLTFEAVEVACRPSRTSTLAEIYAFEIVCSGNWTFDATFKPNVFVDIERYWEKKLAAWKCYEGEDRPFPFPRSVEGLKTLAQYRGMSAGLEKAEAFRLLRAIY